MNKEYFEVNELTDYEKLVKLNDALHMFNKLIPIGGNLHYDASGQTIYSSITARIELKTRHFNVNQYNTLYIEDHKSANLLYDWVALGDEPLYINFFDDAIAIFNLHKLSERPKTSTGRSYSTGYGGWEYNSRNELHIKDAAVYDNEYQLLQEPAWKMKL